MAPPPKFLLNNLDDGFNLVLKPNEDSILYIFPISDIGFKRFIVVGFKYDLNRSFRLSELNFTLIKTVKGHFIICLLISCAIVSWQYIAPIFGLSEWIINIL